MDFIHKNFKGGRLQLSLTFHGALHEGPAAGKVPLGLEGANLDFYKERGWDEKGFSL
jgi:hypothetical protein